MDKAEKKTSIRYSKKREAIYQALKNTKEHPSAEWLFQTLKGDYPDLSLGTVYRNLAFFQAQGTVKSVGVVRGQERYDADIRQHSHFICEHCGKILDLQELRSPVSPELLGQYGFEVERVETNLYGACEHCVGEKLC